MITQKELREKWGIDAGQLSRMVKRGMPLTSEAEAQNWRLANQKRASKLQMKTTEASVEEAEKEQGKATYQQKTSSGRLHRAQQTELAAYNLLCKTVKKENPVEMRAAVQVWGESKKRVAEAEMEHARFEEMARVVIRMDEVREIFTKYLGGIRALMDAMPFSLAARANPSDPECAKRAIQEGIEQIFITITKAEGAFK